ncbi:hypothetical protein BDY19DRAFT_927189 [Irpex rosettiformis]|uniref:Uncharacterized protein n=1 Tax=Irpex rosettiformis TaxID=378272 RepID=A0ACB8UCA8_9APHY|nr:hypothetical protein BDY19DRAFT_927189 [Irpex rosettiformis]
MASEDTQEFKEMSQKVVAANKDHQYALKVYTERLQSELETVDKLLAAADQPDDDLEGDLGGSIAIPETAKAVGPVPHGIIYENSPFAEDAAKRQRYLKSTVIHPMKAAELEALSDAVRSENHRLFALEAQRRGQQPFVAVDQHPPGFFHLNKAGLNWERIASKVSDAGVNYVQRTAQECEIRWLGDRHPEYNHSEWSQEETTRAVELVGSAKEGEVDWVDIAAKLGTKRTPVDCMRHTIQRKVHVWTSEADERLLEAVKIYGLENWQQVARQVSEDATSSQCQNRYIRTVDSTIKRGGWTEGEDILLKNAVSVFGRSWMEVCIWIPGRNNEQCRERWQEVEKTTKQRHWTEAEDEALLDAYKTVGGPRWVEVAKIIGRTSSMCRHRYATLMKRKAKEVSEPGSSSATPGDLDLSPNTEDPAAGPSEPSKSATRRRACQKRKDTEDPPESTKNEGSAPLKPKPKPRPRPRAKRAAPEPEQQGLTEMSVGTSQASTDQQAVVPEQTSTVARGFGSIATGGDVIQDKGVEGLETFTSDTAKYSGPAGPPSKRGRGRPRKNPPLQPETQSPEKEPAVKKRRIACQKSVSNGINTTTSEESATKPSQRKRGKPRKPTTSNTNSSSTVEELANNAEQVVETEGEESSNDAQEQNRQPVDGIVLSAGNGGSRVADQTQSSTLRRSARVRKPVQA